MDNIVLLGSLTGFLSSTLGTVLGAVFAYIWRGKSRRHISFMMEFSAGLMLGIVSFELLPEAFSMAGFPLGAAGFLIGTLLCILTQNYIRRQRVPRDRHSLEATGYSVAAGIAMHNFPEGLAVGSGFGVSPKLGITLALIIALHDVPEGMALALPLKLSKKGMSHAVWTAFLTAIPMALGAFLGALVGVISKEMVGFCLGVAGGAMLWIVSSDIVPESNAMYRGRFPKIGQSAGFLIGAIVSLGIMS